MLHILIPEQREASMIHRLATWPARRMRTLWIAGLLLEAVFILVAATLLERPDPPLVAQLRPGDRSRQVYTATAELRPGATVIVPGRPAVPPPAREDSFYTVLHWPLDKPLTAGGGRVLAMPMRLWWVPALYFTAVPLLLIGLTIAWLWARRGASGRS